MATRRGWPKFTAGERAPVVRNGPIDFIGVDDAVDNRGAEFDAGTWAQFFLELVVAHPAAAAAAPWAGRPTTPRPGAWFGRWIAADDVIRETGWETA